MGIGPGEIWTGVTFFITVCLLPLIHYVGKNISKDMQRIRDELIVRTDALRDNDDRLAQEFKELREHVSSVETKQLQYEVQLSDERHRSTERYVQRADCQMERRAGMRREDDARKEFAEFKESMISEIGKLRLELLREIQRSKEQ